MTRLASDHVRLLAGVASDAILIWMIAEFLQHRYTAAGFWVSENAFLLAAAVSVFAIVSLAPVLRGLPKGEWSWWHGVALLLGSLPALILCSAIRLLFEP